MTRFLTKRGKPVAHLADDQGRALCGVQLGDQWSLSTTASRRVCRRCAAARVVAPGQAPATPTPTPTPAATTEAGPIDVGLLIGKLDELKTSNVSVGRAIEAAVKSLKGSVISG